MDAFFKTLMELSKQSLPPEEVDYPDYEKEEETFSEEPEINYDDIIRENEELKLKLSELEQLQEEALASQSLFEGDPNYALNMVMNNELFEGMMGNKTSSLSWLNVKDKSVNINNVSGTISNYLSSLPDNIRQKLLATSGNDSDTHAKNSKHYNDKAIDLRFDKEVYNYLINDPAFKKSGLKVLDPNHGTAPHIHIEEMKYGGKKYYI